jgi:hypothetical protein
VIAKIRRPRAAIGALAAPGIGQGDSVAEGQFADPRADLLYDPDALVSEYGRKWGEVARLGISAANTAGFDANHDFIVARPIQADVFQSEVTAI